MVPLKHWHQGEALIHQVDRELRKKGESMADASINLPLTLSRPHSLQEVSHTQRTALPSAFKSHNLAYPT